MSVAGNDTVLVLVFILIRIFLIDCHVFTFRIFYFSSHNIFD